LRVGETPARADSWAVSRPTALAPTTINVPGTPAGSMAVVLVKYPTFSKPGIGGKTG